MKTLTKEMLLNEAYEPTTLEFSTYILRDGYLFGGGDYGRRTVEHREMEVFTQYDRNDGEKFWYEIMVEFGLVMIEPENETIYIHPDNTITSEQQNMINLAMNQGYTMRDFT